MTEQELKNYVLELYKNETPIPKPKGNTVLLSVDENQFQYRVGENNNKSVPFATLFACYEKLTTDGELKRQWFAKEFKAEHEARPCNFTTIGGIFVKMEIAEYCGGNSGTYRLVK